MDGEKNHNHHYWRMNMLPKTQSGFITHLLTALLAGSLLLSACTPVISTPTQTDEVPTATAVPMATEVPTATAAPEATALPTEDGSLHFSIDTGGLASGFQTETIAAVSADTGAPIREVLPEHTRVTLQGYLIGSHRYQPQIFIYPLAELIATNESAATVAATLQTMLQSPQEIPEMPFLPLVNQAQVIHANVQYLDFQSGQGLRYLTEFSQGIMPLNNSELIYTYQGLTSDGKYYVAAVLPVNHPSLPAEAGITGNEPLEFSSDYTGYKANLANTLNTAAADTFTPDLTLLDAMMSSLEIK
jgi:hypothetical protein